MATNGECFLRSINNSTNRCEYVLQNCEYSYINYYYLHYCLLDEKLYCSLPIMCFFGFLCFSILTDTADRYLSCALTQLTDKIGLSQNLAAVTLLAFGNGAADVITSLVASSTQGGEGIEVSIGNLLGGGLALTSLVFSILIILGKKAKVQKELFIRDIIFYLIALSTIILFAVVGKITLLMSCCYLLIYVAYVIVAIVQDVMKKNERKKEKTISNERKTFSIHAGDVTYFSVTQDGKMHLLDKPSNPIPEEDDEDSVIMQPDQVAERISTSIRNTFYRENIKNEESVFEKKEEADADKSNGDINNTSMSSSNPKMY
jgi:Ca2+/Na+ antiporter